MIGALGLDSALVSGPGTTWANEMNIAMNYAPGAGMIARPVDQKSSALPLYHPAQPVTIACLESLLCI